MCIMFSGVLNPPQKPIPGARNRPLKPGSEVSDLPRRRGTTPGSSRCHYDFVQKHSWRCRLMQTLRTAEK